jgi:hypothetical protein
MHKEEEYEEPLRKANPNPLLNVFINLRNTNPGATDPLHIRNQDAVTQNLCRPPQLLALQQQQQ